MDINITTEFRLFIEEYKRQNIQCKKEQFKNQLDELSKEFEKCPLGLYLYLFFKNLHMGIDNVDELIKLPTFKGDHILKILRETVTGTVYEEFCFSMLDIVPVSSVSKFMDLYEKHSFSNESVQQIVYEFLDITKDIKLDTDQK